MATRPLDVTAAALALLPAAPLCLVAAAGIWLCDGRPVLYASRRAGRGGAAFTMYKFRTMRLASRAVRPDDGQSGAAGAGSGADAACGGLITADGDSRVFAFGAWLRRWKIDELPQLVNVLRGDMAIVGPRPEDPAIVDRFYTPLARETLTVRPGLASPGSIYNFTHGERQLAAAESSEATVDVDEAYGRGLLPRKLALDLVYVRAASVGYDLRIVCRAALTIVAHGFGRCIFPDPPEMPRARQLEGLLHRSPVPPAELP